MTSTELDCDGHDANHIVIVESNPVSWSELSFRIRDGHLEILLTERSSLGEGPKLATREG